MQSVGKKRDEGGTKKEVHAGRGRGCEKEGNRRNVGLAEYRNETEGGPRTKRERAQGYAAGLERPRKEEDGTWLSWKEIEGGRRGRKRCGPRGGRDVSEAGSAQERGLRALLSIWSPVPCATSGPRFGRGVC